MGDTTYIAPANDYLAKPMAIAINDADGTVVWAKKYFEGFAIAGSYSHSDTYTFTATDPVALRVDQTWNLLWAKLYDSPNSAYGFARGIRQNVYFFGGRLDVYTSWENYQNDIDGSNTVSGLLRINEADGLSNGIMIYDVPNDDFAGMSMNEDGSGGYLAIGTRDIAPFDTFQLIYSRVNNVKFSSDSFLDNVLLVIIHKESLSL